MHSLAKLVVPEGKLGIHWFEQNAYAVKDAQGFTVLVDPYFPHERPAEVFIHADPPVDERELPVNAVLLTHDHDDHTHPETIGRIRRAWSDACYVGSEGSIARIVREAGVAPERARVIAAGESLDVGAGVRVHAVYSKPPEGDPVAGIARPDTTHLGFVLEMGGRRLYFSGDPIRSLATRAEIVDAVRALRPEIGFVTTHPSEGEFPYFAEAADAARGMGLRAVVPSHYACFVARTYDPREFAAAFDRPGDPRPIVLPWNSSTLFP